MPKYKIALLYQRWACVEVEAESLDAAEQKAMERVPEVSEYVDDSMVLDRECTDYGLVEEAVNVPTDN